MPIDLPVSIKTVRMSDGQGKTIVYPRVKGLANQTLEHLINRVIVSATRQLIHQQIQDSPSTLIEMIASYEIKNNQRRVLSLSLSNYAYHYHAAHGMTYLRALTFDLEQGKLCQLNDLFKPGSDYSAALLSLIREQIKQRNIQLLNDLPPKLNEQAFYIADKTIVLYFQLYEITPYVFGFPMFPISVYDVWDIIDENGPLGRMAAQ
ncbi:DUF3298 domain-containing protein [Siminovitchia sediminis]|uniref:DUF3298 domain-containing protein n=1 Tax=Siminovitchia sediminis TaxID=1274353 RepID=A0ABW4KH30_9BACI